ncbi:MAG: HEAT repeat domain-containing protein [Myxococcales bacterium]|nr:HEAT repeat domain-containing protein [Myxococcales bacterium]MCB9669722.1 HEAT repeat domain-containing protein [Alphaproteobacteria bacterium]
MPSREWFDAVPLNVPLPDGPWTTLLQELGFEAAFGESAFPDELLTDLLVSAGRPVMSDESRLLRWVTPIPSGPTPTERLVDCLSRGSAVPAARELGLRGDADAVGPLRMLLGTVRPWMRGSIWVALARLGVAGEGVREWEPDAVEEQLLARLLLGEVLDEVPASLPDAFGAWLEAPTAAGLTALLECTSSGSVLSEAVALLARVFPATLDESLVEVTSRATEEPAWLETLLAAGDDVLEELVEVLGAPDWRARMGAAIVLGSRPELPEVAVETLRAALADDDSDVRREAALALHRHDASVPLAEWTSMHGYPTRVAAVVPGFSGPPVSGLAFGALLQSWHGQLGARLVLGLALEDPALHAPLFDRIAKDPTRDQPIEVRRAAAAASLLGGVVPTAMPELLRVLLRGEGEAPASTRGLRLEALLALAARDADWEVRVAALRLAARCGGLEAHVPLLQILAESDSDGTVREIAAGLLPARFRSETPGDLLASSIVRDPADAESRSRALGRLAEVAPERTRGLAEALSSSDDRDLALMGSRLLGRFAAEAAPDLARRGLAGLKSESWVRREAAAALLGNLPAAGLGADLAEELAEVLEVVGTDDDDADVRRMAAWAAVTLRGER